MKSNSDKTTFLQYFSFSSVGGKIITSTDDPPHHYRLDYVHFDVDKATLRPDSYGQIKELPEYLQQHKGIKATKLSVKGYGSAVAVAVNSTEGGRQLNKRTEVRIQ